MTNVVHFFQRFFILKTLNGQYENDSNLKKYFYTKIENQNAADKMIADVVF